MTNDAMTGGAVSWALFHGAGGDGEGGALEAEAAVALDLLFRLGFTWNSWNAGAAGLGGGGVAARAPALAGGAYGLGVAPGADGGAHGVVQVPRGSPFIQMIAT